MPQALEQKLSVSLSPHVQSRDSVSSVMWAVNFALLPAMAVSVWSFGIRVLAIIAVSVITSVITEWAVTRFMFKRESTIADGSAVLTGLLLSFNVPAGIPLWMVAAGALFAMGIGKMVFGGVGHNPFNPALVGRAFMLASFPGDMATWPARAESLLDWNVDAFSGATPLAQLAEGGTAGLPGNMELFLGTISGSAGEISALAILIGGLYLLYKKIIGWETPVIFLGTLALFTGIFWIVDPTTYADPLFHLLAGGAMLGAWFMATDMVTSPMTFKGRVIYAASAGLLTGIIRLFGAYPEGVSYAILIMNAFVPVIDKYVRPRRFGIKPVPVPAPTAAGGEK
jgi:electron transport complex protein RnfD